MISTVSTRHRAGRRGRRLLRSAVVIAAVPAVLAVATGVSAAATTSGTAPAAAPAGTLSIGPASMEGDLKAPAGSHLAIGYDVTVPGSHPASTITVQGIRATAAYECPDGAPSGVLSYTLPAASLTVPANSSGWFPSGDQSSPSTYQFATVLPAACGAGQILRAPGRSCAWTRA